MGSNIKNKGTGGMIESEFAIMIAVKSTLKKYTGGKKNPESMDHIADLVKRIEKRNDDGTIKSDTVL